METELKANLGAYNLGKALAADRTSGSDCFVLDVGRGNEGKPLSSLERVINQVDDYLRAYVDKFAVPITKLYVVGEWNLAHPKDGTAQTTKQGRYENKPQNHTSQEQEWHEAGVQVTRLVQRMPALKELTWISGLPFMTCIWEKVQVPLTKLVLDLGQPVRLQQDGDFQHKSYITSAEMKPLQRQTALKELRLFGIPDSSLQFVIWETVYSNTFDNGMRVLDLQMAAAPLVRSKHWRKAEDVVGLTVPKTNPNEKEYKGIEGKGCLHHFFGTGEYLDDFCMRKARISSKLNEDKPLPLWCLKLDGFVVDYLPFEHELSRIVLLTCGKNCVDAGLRAPTTLRAPRNRWSRAVNNAVTHCLIQWPNWTGIFDDHGDQRDKHGDVVSQEVGLSTPASEFPSSPTVPLTKAILHMKELDDALDGVKDECYFASPKALLSSVVAQTPMTPVSMVSNLSTRGSDVSTPTGASITRSSPGTGNGSDVCSSGSGSLTDASLVLVNSNTTDSIGDSFEQVSPPPGDGTSDVAANGFATFDSPSLNN
ncbi:hypothetical protein EJ02DRAFT_140610 [Clathrospora elynae]|uniref:Uncharacterized protein n=1 Tax=Clathrospora elynae TaxID=706981 RepID=A0A6A5T5H9_9PLEO|nr:hypothetical protein EJ02DRAFT_140610 [Clathrospora elynae]